MSVVDEKKLEAAMEFLAETDDHYAKIKALMLRCEIICKRVRARIYLTAEGSVESRKAAAEVHDEAIGADDTYIGALTEFESLKAKRSRAEIVIDVWRSLEASRRKA
jgi:predicted transcriptional regulator